MCRDSPRDPLKECLRVVDLDASAADSVTYRQARIERRRIDQDVVALERFDLATVPRQRELCVIGPAVPLMPRNV